MIRVGSFALLLCLLLSRTASGEDKESPDGVQLSPSLLNTLENLGANSAVPDGFGLGSYSRRPVRNQPGELGWVDALFGLTIPLTQSASNGTFLNLAYQQRSFQKQGRIRLPDDRVPFPSHLTRIEIGGTYIHQFDDGDSLGASILAGSASDKPFRSFRDANATLLAFYRLAQPDDTAWMFYVVSSSTGQVGENIPIPGVAYELKGDDYSATLGFPFINARYRPWEDWEVEVNYAALIDLQLRYHYRPEVRFDFFSGFTWTNQSWLRNNRPVRNEQLFSYEKRLELGAEYHLLSKVSVQLLTGYVFDRIYTESTGLPIYGRNRVRIAPGEFVALQFLLHF